MTEWMEYVYMQMPKPTDTTGVEVVLSVFDSNGNFREISRVTSDPDGFYSLQWTPDIPGKYTVYASFAGSEAFWPSHATTAFGVDPALEPVVQEEVTQPPSMTDVYVLSMGIAILVAVVIVGAVLAMILKKRQ